MNSIKSKPAIRIVKSSDRNRREDAAQIAPKSAKKSAQVAAREMVATVTEWVNDLHHRQHLETARALRTLFPEASVVAK